MSRKKIRRGQLITSLDHLARFEWVIIHGKPYNHGWVISWTMRTAKRYVDGGHAYEGIRLTNAEYYSKLSDAQIMKRFGGYHGELHKVCPYGRDRDIVGECGAGYCEEAIIIWKGEPVT